jgi:hypothetical protein
MDFCFWAEGWVFMFVGFNKARRSVLNRRSAQRFENYFLFLSSSTTSKSASTTSAFFSVFLVAPPAG